MSVFSGVHLACGCFAPLCQVLHPQRASEHTMPCSCWARCWRRAMRCRSGCWTSSWAACWPRGRTTSRPHTSAPRTLRPASRHPGRPASCHLDSLQLASTHWLDFTEAAPEHHTQQRSFCAAALSRRSARDALDLLRMIFMFLHTNCSSTCAAQAGAGIDPSQRGAAAAVAAALPDRGYGWAAHGERAAGGLPPPHLSGTNPLSRVLSGSAPHPYMMRSKHIATIS